MCDKVSNDVQVNGVVLWNQSEILQREANKQLQITSNLSLKLSKEWLDRFHKRYGVKFHRFHGEALRADDDGLAANLLTKRAKIATYHPENVCNANEFGFFYRQPPIWSLSHKPASVFKRNNTRITVLACCNSYDSEKLPIMIIVNSLSPRPFQS